MARRRCGRLGRSGFAVLAAMTVVLVLFGAVAYATVRPTTDVAARKLYKASGRVKIRDSRGTDAILGMRGMLPGDCTAGTVRIGNASRFRARFYLGFSRLVESPGAGGGRLSYRLVLTVKRLSAKRRPQTVYVGPLRQMPLVKLGIFRPNETRTYRFSVLFPAGGTSNDGRFAGGSTSLEFDWYARRAR